MAWIWLSNLDMAKSICSAFVTIYSLRYFVKSTILLQFEIHFFHDKWRMAIQNMPVTSSESCQDKSLPKEKIIK